MAKLQRFNLGGFDFEPACIRIIVRLEVPFIALVSHIEPPDRCSVSSGQRAWFLWSAVATSWTCRPPDVALAGRRHAAFPSEPSFRVDQIPCLPWAKRLLIHVDGPSVPTLRVFGF